MAATVAASNCDWVAATFWPSASSMAARVSSSEARNAVVCASACRRKSPEVEREMLLEGVGMLRQRIDLLLRFRVEGFDSRGGGRLELSLGRGDILAERLVNGGADLVERGAQRPRLCLGMRDGIAGGQREMLLEGVGMLRQRVDLLLRFRVEGFDSRGGGRLESRLGCGDILAKRLVNGVADLVERGAQRPRLRLGMRDGIAGGQREMLLEGVGMLRQRVDLLLRFRVEGFDSRSGGRLESRLGRGDILAERLVNGGADLVERGAQGPRLRLSLHDRGA